jgi:hypothetical protein
VATAGEGDALAATPTDGAGPTEAAGLAAGLAAAPAGGDAAAAAEGEPAGAGPVVGLLATGTLVTVIGGGWL